MNFPSWRVEEIQTSGLKISNCPAWWRLEAEFLTLASELYNDPKWQKLAREQGVV